MLHYHAIDRARQLRWVLPSVILFFVAVLITLGVVYRLGNQDVGTEFFHAHIKVSHTGELLQRGMIIGAAVLTALVIAIGLWAIPVTHRRARPIHPRHPALAAAATAALRGRRDAHRA